MSFKKILNFVLVVSLIIGGSQINYIFAKTSTNNINTKKNVAKNTTNNKAKGNQTKKTTTNQKNNIKLDTGTVQGSVYKTYTNKYLGLTIHMPKKWSYSVTKNLEEAKSKGYVTLIISKKKMGTTGINEAFAMEMIPSVDSSDLDTYTKVFLEYFLNNQEIKYSIIKKASNITIAKNKFKTFEICGNYGGIKVYQKMYFVVRKNTLLMFFTTSLNEKTGAEFNSILNSITFKN